MKKQLSVLFATTLVALTTFAQTPVIPPSSGGGGSSGGSNSGVTSTEVSPSPVGTVNSEEVARLIASKGITEFRGEFEFRRLLETSEEQIRGTFRLSYGRIVNLVINGVEIPDENDRYTLPVNAIGTVRSFSLTVEGVNNQERVLFGSFWAYELQPGETIQIVLRPNAVPFFLAYSPESGTDAGSLRLSVQNGTDGYDTYYDAQHSGFSVWLTPGVETSYRIYDARSNRTIETGLVDTTHLVVIPSEDPILLTSVLGNVAYTQNGYFSQGGLQMDSTVVNDDGTTTPGKVIAYNNSEGKKLRIITYGLSPGSQILVKKTDEELTVVQSFTIPSGDYGSVIFTTSNIVESAVVTITGAVQPADGFFLNLNALRDSGGNMPIPAPRIPTTPLTEEK
ncbi:MAG: hypothetical protein AAB595_02625 [Patescibacteria group bacterium]